MQTDLCLAVGRGSSVDRLEGQYPCLRSDASYYTEPVEVTEETEDFVNHVLYRSAFLCDE